MFIFSNLDSRQQGIRDIRKSGIRKSGISGNPGYPEIRDIAWIPGNATSRGGGGAISCSGTVHRVLIFRLSLPRPRDRVLSAVFDRCEKRSILGAGSRWGRDACVTLLSLLGWHVVDVEVLG